MNERVYDLGFSCRGNQWESSGAEGRIVAHLLLLPESEETDTRDLDDLETDTGNITLGLAATTETRDEDFVVLIDKVQATIVLCAKNSICVSIFWGWPH